MTEISRKKLRKIIILAVAGGMLAAVLLLAALDLTGVLAVTTGGNYEKMIAMSNKYSKLYDIQKKIDEKCLWKISEEKQMDAIYKGLVGSLDDKYSEYFNAEEAQEWKNAIDGTYYGIGISFGQQENGDFMVYKVFIDSPAEKAGLEQGDIIREVDGKTYETSDEVSEAVRGKSGTTVKITYERNGKKHTVEVMRAEVNDSSVESRMLEDGIGYIWISSFSKNTAKEFQRELSGMEGKSVKGLVIDVRENGGGYMDQGLKVADMLLPEGTITYTEDRNGKREYFNSKEGATDLPYVLLVDQNTASTSEILAAAIKDNDGGKLIGETTFGKGIVQVEYSYKDGSELKLTSYQYFSPNGNTIHKKGVTPDYKVKFKIEDGNDEQLNKAIEVLKKSLD